MTSGPSTHTEIPADPLSALAAILHQEQRIRLPLFPSYSQVRHLLRLWQGRPRKLITGLEAAINQLRGTPQNTVKWTDPDQWIPERLCPDHQQLAQAIWQGSAGAVNPRYTRGARYLAQKYELIDEDAQGRIQLTLLGRDLIEQPGGMAEATLDEAEGLVSF